MIKKPFSLSAMPSGRQQTPSRSEQEVTSMNEFMVSYRVGLTRGHIIRLRDF